MPGAPLLYGPPTPTTGNVLYGLGIVMTAPVGTALPAAAIAEAAAAHPQLRIVLD